MTLFAFRVCAYSQASVPISETHMHRQTPWLAAAITLLAATAHAQTQPSGFKVCRTSSADDGKYCMIMGMSEACPTKHEQVGPRYTSRKAACDAAYSTHLSFCEEGPVDYCDGPAPPSR